MTIFRFEGNFRHLSAYHGNTPPFVISLLGRFIIVISAGFAIPLYKQRSLSINIDNASRKCHLLKQLLLSHWLLLLSLAVHQKTPEICLMQKKVYQECSVVRVKTQEMVWSGVQWHKTLSRAATKLYLAITPKKCQALTISLPAFFVCTKAAPC